MKELTTSEKLLRAYEEAPSGDRSALVAFLRTHAVEIRALLREEFEHSFTMGILCAAAFTDAIALEVEKSVGACSDSQSSIPLPNK
jgi:hypothetical protein